MTFLEKTLEDPVRFARLKRWSVAALAGLALAEIALGFFYPDDAHFPFDDIPAWGSLYGLASCVAIIVVSKLIGKLWLMRGEDYYGS
jgi:hypothetical protein